MTGTHTDLLAECEAHGIRFTLSGDGGLTIDAPRDALTPDLLARLKANKPGLLTIVRGSRAEPDAAPGDTMSVERDADVQSVDEPPPPVETSDAPVPTTKQVCRCGSREWRDVPIHRGQSVRRDCQRCGRFLDFPVWYGKNALHYEQ